jgi:hypothetical protein
MTILSRLWCVNFDSTGLTGILRRTPYLPPPVGLEQVLNSLEKMRFEPVGGNAGGNISREQLAELRAWSDLYRRASELYERLANS